MKNLKKILSVWRKRNLTIFGKCTIINTLAVSKLVYNAFILPNPDKEFFKRVSKIIFNFLWKKRERIKRNTLIGKIEQGGIGIVDIESKFSAAKASWVRRILDKDTITHFTLNSLLENSNLSINDIIKTTSCNLNDAKFWEMTNFPQFYVEVFSMFNKCKKNKQNNRILKEEFLSQFIWHNNLFRYDSKTLCFEQWIKSGILYVKDLFDENGEIHAIDYFWDKLKCKNNIYCEYIILKKTLRPFKSRLDCSYANYINIQNNDSFLFRNNCFKSIKSLKSDFYYSVLVQSKFQNSIYENKWNKYFNIEDKSLWKNIYISKICNMYDKKDCRIQL